MISFLSNHHPKIMETSGLRTEVWCTWDLASADCPVCRIQVDGVEWVSSSFVCTLILMTQGNLAWGHLWGSLPSPGYTSHFSLSSLTKQAPAGLNSALNSKAQSFHYPAQRVAVANIRGCAFRKPYSQWFLASEASISRYLDPLPEGPSTRI